MDASLVEGFGFILFALGPEIGSMMNLYFLFYRRDY